MDVIKFSQFINESNTNDSISLYRIVSVGNNQNLVIDTSYPGKYYFKNKEDISPDVLSKKGKEYHIVQVTTSLSNIDQELSQQESVKQNCECVVLKNDSKADIELITPFK